VEEGIEESIEKHLNDGPTFFNKHIIKTISHGALSIGSSLSISSVVKGSSNPEISAG
jgi:hypothetical protein